MSAAEAARKESLFGLAERALPSGAADFAWFVPGRVELLGKHTDYAGGRSLLCTVERGFCVLARARPDAGLQIVDAGSGSRVEFSLRSEAVQTGWAVYPATVARRLVRDFGITRGVELAFASDLPVAAGLSSSTALCIGVFLALSSVNALDQTPAYRSVAPDLFELAGYLGAVENGRPFGPFAGELGVGTLGGSQDQTAILCSIIGELVQFSFDPVRFERRLPFPAGHCLVVATSGVLAEKTGSARAAYNTASQAVLEIQRRWREATGRDDHTLADVVASSPDAREKLLALVAQEPVLRARLEQFLSESEELVPAAASALARGDLASFGDLVDRSQAGAERGLGNQIPETIHLQQSARGLGAVAASAFGAGFGGSVWALLPADDVEAFRQTWARDYGAVFPHRARAARFFTALPGPAALRLELAL
ncbi:MAG TPA: galactokinase family protein [Gemmatimonadales bacterium]|jgi:galactokinase|nr:galactokinase family protein [Gemmatimonadales bacterium]